ncbi:MAG TPA: SRPBCC family protein [Gaiellaceae bacterium]|nr:SRPBCC family protein [Gaiellaceae bacterium]
MTQELARTQLVPRGLGETFAFFADPRNLEAITPPWLNFRILEAPERLERGSFLRYRLRLYGIPLRWLTEIEAWQPPRGFTDRQLRGPYRLWVHTHRFTAVEDGTEIYDNVRYRVPGGRLAPTRIVRGLVEEIFDYREARLRELLG